MGVVWVRVRVSIMVRVGVALVRGKSITATNFANDILLTLSYPDTHN